MTHVLSVQMIAALHHVSLTHALNHKTVTVQLVAENTYTTGAKLRMKKNTKIFFIVRI